MRSLRGRARGAMSFAKSAAPLPSTGRRRSRLPLRAGRVPTFETLPQLSHNARELLEAESRVAAAEIAASDLAGAKSEAALAVTKARDELRQAARA